MTFYHWLGIDAELFHLGQPELEHLRRDALIALGYLKS